MRLPRTLWLLLVSLASGFGVAAQVQANQPGAFDYYLLSLSWEPEFCYQARGKHSDECDHSHTNGFILHGLWPALTQGESAEYCSHTPGLSRPAQALDIMPTAWLIHHEWDAHGTCSGLTAERYFSVVRQAYRSITIPDIFQHPSHGFSLPPAKIKQAFINSNPGLAPEDMALSCRNNYLSAAAFCLNKTTLKPERCGDSVRDCHARSIKVAPVK
jgi:ribonuclease T2